MASLTAFVRPSAATRVINTIEIIVSSNAVGQYKTGITLNYRSRRNQYGGDPVDPYPHFVVLEACLSAEAALQLERIVHDRIVQSDGRSAMGKKKWAGAYDKYCPSLGGRSLGDNREYYFYLAWK